MLADQAYLDVISAVSVKIGRDVKVEIDMPPTFIFFCLFVFLSPHTHGILFLMVNPKVLEFTDNSIGEYALLSLQALCSDSMGRCSLHMEFNSKSLKTWKISYVNQRETRCMRCDDG